MYYKQGFHVEISLDIEKNSSNRCVTMISGACQNMQMYRPCFHTLTVTTLRDPPKDLNARDPKTTFEEAPEKNSMLNIEKLLS